MDCHQEGKGADRSIRAPDVCLGLLPQPGGFVATDFATPCIAALLNRHVRDQQRAPSSPNASTSPASPVANSGGWFKDSVTVGYGGSSDPNLAAA